MISKLMYWVRKTIATGFFTGYFPYGPGTVGSAITILLFYFAAEPLSFLFGPENAVSYWWVMVLLVGFCVLMTSKSKETFGREDPPQVVLDEITGQFITFFLIPISVRTLFLGFVLFRFFDIVKPFPVHAMEELEDGMGITMDDVVAGVLANVSLMLMISVYQWLVGFLT
ncbi:Phosphatidylglycerophosphatase A [Chitinispirillum alkaliphilum]|nr:Phosphatidylglycerophosphatase A [Chitinispirillum alkaliphilum]